MPAKGVPLKKGKLSTVLGKELQVQRSPYEPPVLERRSVAFDDLSILQGIDPDAEWPTIEATMAAPVQVVNDKSSNTQKGAKNHYDNRVSEAISGAIDANWSPYQLPLLAAYLVWNEKPLNYTYTIQCATMDSALILLPAHKAFGCFFALYNYLQLETEFHRRNSAAFTGDVKAKAGTSFELYIGDFAGPDYDSELHVMHPPKTTDANRAKRESEAALRVLRRARGERILSKSKAAQQLFLHFFSGEAFADPVGETFDLHTQGFADKVEPLFDPHIALRNAAYNFRPMQRVVMDDYTPGCHIRTEVNAIHRSKVTDTAVQWEFDWANGMYHRNGTKATLGGMEGEAGFQDGKLEVLEERNAALELKLAALERQGGFDRTADLDLEERNADLVRTLADIELAAAFEIERESELNAKFDDLQMNFLDLTREYDRYKERSGIEGDKLYETITKLNSRNVENCECHESTLTKLRDGILKFADEPGKPRLIEVDKEKVL